MTNEPPIHKPRKVWAILSTHSTTPDLVVGHYFRSLGDAISRCAFNDNTVDIVRIRWPDDLPVTLSEGNPEKMPSLWEKFQFLVFGDFQ